MSYECPIYTNSNWHMITYLFNGTYKDNTYTVYLDAGSASYNTAIAKLNKVSPYLAQVIASYADMNGVVFVRRF